MARDREFILSRNLEIELKLDVEPSARDRLQSSALLSGASSEHDHLKASYFDTPDLAVHRAGFSLRIRKEGRRRVQTVKSETGVHAGLFTRSEWEKAVKRKRLRADEIDGPLAKVLDETALNGLRKMFVTDIGRTRRLIHHGDMSAELVVDEGDVRTDAARTSLMEVELELIEGPPQSLFEFARRLDEDVPVRVGVLSKAERGYRLIEGSADGSLKAEPILLDPAGEVGEAFVMIAQSCIRQFRRNEDLLREHDGADALHQARVGIRRLRSAFSLFKPLIGRDERAELLKLELRELGAVLGVVRNLDVLIPRLKDGHVAQLSEERHKAMAHLRARLSSSRTRLLMLDLIEWLTVGQWQADPANAKLRRAPVLDFANDLLEARRRRLKRRGKGLASLDDDDRHQVRIEAKKLRYATEFFASLYPTKRRKTFLTALEDMQDCLGELNDLATAPQVLESLGLAGALPATGQHERARLLDRSQDAFDALIATKRFWR